MKDPAFLFYSSDFLTGTMFMSNEQVGQYIRLLCAQHQTGHLSKKHMLSICNASDIEVLDKFIIDDGGLYYNERLEFESNKRSKFAESRRNNAKGRRNKPLKTTKAYAEHMENENENENRDINRDINANKSEIIFPFDGQGFLDMWQHWKDYKKGEFNFKYKSFESEQAALSKLSKLADTEKLAIEIITQSIENGWKGFFKLKFENESKKSMAEIYLKKYANEQGVTETQSE